MHPHSHFTSALLARPCPTITVPTLRRQAECWKDNERHTCTKARTHLVITQPSRTQDKDRRGMRGCWFSHNLARPHRQPAHLRARQQVLRDSNLISEWAESCRFVVPCAERAAFFWCFLQKCTRSLLGARQHRSLWGVLEADESANCTKI